MEPTPFPHQSVLAAAVVEAFAALPPAPDGGPPRLIDCTLGGGGHSALLLAAHPSLEVVGLDQDATARAAAAAQLAPWGERVRIVARNFAAFTPERPVQAVLADLGVSSPQLDRPERGFSFRADGPIDMRMDPTTGETAAALLDRLDETELANLLYALGTSASPAASPGASSPSGPTAPGGSGAPPSWPTSSPAATPPKPAVAASIPPPAASRPCASP